MGYNQDDELAINTIRLLAVGLKSPPPPNPTPPWPFSQIPMDFFFFSSFESVCSLVAVLS